MARVVVYSMGFRGDVFPYVPIASELAARGHEVTYVVPQEFHRLLAGLGVRCVAPGFDIGPTLLDQHGRYVAGFGGARIIRQFFGRFMGPHIEALHDTLDAEVARADADVVLTQTLASAVAAMVCERRGVPMVLGDLFPMQVPTAHSAPATVPDLGRLLNRLLWRGGRYIAANHMPGTGRIRAHRRRLGLKPNGWSMMDVPLTSALTLGLTSRWYVDHMPDWPDHYRQVGFTAWSGPTGDSLPDDVAAFLDAAEPPIIVTQGTAAAAARTEFFVRATNAVQGAGGRAIVLTSNDTVNAEVRRQLTASGRHAAWPFVPLALLLPRCRGIVHAGTLGTTALTLAAGLPSAISPCMVDAAWHAQRHEALGVGVRIRRHNLDRAVRRLTADDDLRERARALGEHIAAEDGAGAACDEIEVLLSSSPRG